jgi:hypothetical protein
MSLGTRVYPAPAGYGGQGSFRQHALFLSIPRQLDQYEVLKMLKKEGKISGAIIESMLSWRHSGFHVYLV